MVYEAKCFIGEHFFSHHRVTIQECLSQNEMRREAILALKDIHPEMRGEDARIYLNGYVQDRRIMGQRPIIDLE